jgi:hypothetical protein
MFRISEVVGVSRPAKPATLFRAISIKFIQTGRVRKDRKEDFNDASFRAAQRCAVRVAKIRAIDQGLA